jgi:hypothetical protein
VEDRAVIVGFDTETYPIRPGRQAPLVVCVQTRAGGVEPREEGLDRLEALLASEAVLTAHSAAYDAACSIASRPRLLRPWFEAYSADRVTCTKVREKLITIADGSAHSGTAYDLLSCLERRKVPHDFKAGDKGGDPDAWRVRYAELDGVPVAQWPAEAVRYALADLSVEDLHAAQEDKPAEYLVDQYRQSRADFLLYLQSCSGMRTDPRAIDAFARKVEIEHEHHRRILQAEGIVRSDGSRILAEARGRMRSVCETKGLPVAITKTGRENKSEAFEYTALDADACLASGDEVLKSYARYTSVGTLRKRAARLALAGTIPIQPRFDVLKRTGRTSSSMGDVKPGKPLLAFGDQVQNLNREPGLRECYVARPGHVLISVDWSAAELHSLAQVCTWMGLESGLADVLNAGRDPHMNFGAHMNGWGYEWAKHQALKGLLGEAIRKAAKAARQGGKAANFGFPGGLGVAKFRQYAAKTYGVGLTEEEAYELREWWFRLYPEMRHYFAHINQMLEECRDLVHGQTRRLGPHAPILRDRRGPAQSRQALELRA